MLIPSLAFAFEPHVGFREASLPLFPTDTMKPSILLLQQSPRYTAITVETVS